MSPRLKSLLAPMIKPKASTRLGRRLRLVGLLMALLHLPVLCVHAWGTDGVALGLIFQAILLLWSCPWPQRRTR